MPAAKKAVKATTSVSVVRRKKERASDGHGTPMATRPSAAVATRTPPTSTALSIGSRAQPTATALHLPDDLTFEEWEEIGSAIAVSERAVTWWAGDWIAFGMDHVETGSWRRPSMEVQEIADRFSMQPDSLMRAAWLSRTIAPDDRVEGATWLHHRLVASASSIPEDERRGWLERAVAEGWTTGETRKHIQLSDRPVLQADSVRMPTGRFDVVYADPPWPTEGGSRANYPTLSFGEIMHYQDAEGRAVQDLAEDDAICFLWVVNQYLTEGLATLEVWGFDYRSNLVWDKVKAMGLGEWVRQRHEILLVGVRGSFRGPVDPKVRIDSVLAVAKREHSRKPDEVRAWIDGMYPGARRIELFARTAPEGWEVVGNQSDMFAEAPA